ncbi:unnamed protein product [Lota lota]
MNTTGGCMSSMPIGYTSRLRGPYIACELLIALIAVIGNFLVCLAVSRNRRLRTVTNYFLVSLSVADILVGLVAIPCAVLTDLGRPHHDLPLCLVLLSILMVLTQSSILSMLAVAVERYVAILRPFHYQRIMSPRNARLALLLTWSLALLSGSVPLMDWQSQNHDSAYCLFTCVVDMTFMVYFNFFGCLLLPLLFMFIIYAHIFYTMRHQLRRIAVARGTPAVDGGSRGGVGKTTPRLEAQCEAGGAREPDPGEPARTGASNQMASGVRTKTFRPIIQTKDTAVFQKTSRRSVRTSCSGSDDRPSGSAAESNKPARAQARLEIQKAASLFLVLFIFMVCLMPIHLINCILLLRPQCPVPMPITLGAILLSHANSALNPLLYAFRMRSFRHTLRGMCPWRSTLKRH